MFRRITTGAVAALAAVGIAVTAAPAQAGSNNGTTNWYKSTYCTASGGRLDITNYDKIVSGSIWQEYHIYADRAGGVGGTPVIYMRPNSNYAWQRLSYWNDFYIRQSNEWQVNDFKVVFSNGSACARGAF